MSVGLPQIVLTVHSVPVIDTGIGIEAGYESDVAMLAAAEAKRAALPPAVRTLLDQVDAEVERRILFGC